MVRPTGPATPAAGASRWEPEGREGVSGRGAHALLAAGAFAGAIAAAGCGGVRAADLFIVSRSGSSPHAALTLLVNEEGGVNCNGRPTGQLSDTEIVKARAITEELQDLASKRTSLPPRPGSVMSYRVRDANGAVGFSDNSAGQPKVLHELALFVLRTAQEVCGLPE
jgi:hypothetical protein